MQSRFFRLCCAFLLCVQPVTSLAAIGATIGVPQHQSQLPARVAPAADVQIIISEGQVKFIAKQPNQQLRLIVQNQFGETLYDSGLNASNQLDWNLADSNGTRLKGGLYRYSLQLKAADSDGLRSQAGTFIIEKTEDQIWITTKDDTAIGADVQGGELTVARAGDRTVAGARTASSEAGSKRTLSGRDVEDEKGNKLFDAKGQTDKLVAAILGTPGRIAKFDGSGNPTADSIMAESGATVTAAGNLNVTGQYQINGQRAMLGVTGANNVFLGQFAGNANTTGNHNMFLGIGAGQLNTTGTNNMFIGPFSGGNTVSGVGNTYVGVLAGDKNTSGSNNVAIGSSAGYLNTTGGDNVTIGASAGVNTNGGVQNVMIGSFAGSANTSGSTNTYLGTNSNGNATVNNATAVGANAKVDCSNCMVLGSINGVNGANANTRVGIGTTTPARALEIGNGQLRFSSAFGDVEFTEIADFWSNISTASPAPTTPAFRFDSGSATKRILTGLHNGNVGIGSTSFAANPIAPLTFDNTVGNKVILWPQSSLYGLGVQNNLLQIFSGDAANDVAIGHGSTIGSAGFVERMRVKGNGKIGFNAPNIPANRGMQILDPGSTSNAYVQIGGIDTWTSGEFRGLLFGDSDLVFIGEGDADDRLLLRGNQGIELRTGGAAVFPSGNGTQNLGGSSNRWNTVYAANGTINTSDRRMKTGIANLNYGLNALMQLRPVSFEWKDNSTDNKTHLGLVAQEVAEVLPEVVHKDADPNVALGLNYSEIVPVLIKAVQEQQTMLKQKEAQLNSLQKRLNRLEKRTSNFNRR